MIIFLPSMDTKLPRTVYSIQFIVLVAYSSMAVLNLLPVYFESLGGSPRQIGLLIGIFSLASFLSRPLGGWLLNRAHPKKVLMAGLFLFLSMTLLYGKLDSLGWWMVAVRFLHGVGFSIFIIAALFVVLVAVREDQSAYAIGVVSTGFMLPLLIAPYLGEQIIDKWGFGPFFLLAGVLAFIPFVYVSSTRLAHSPAPIESQKENQNLLQLLRQKNVLIFSLLAFVFEVGLSSSLAFVPLFVLEKPGMRAGYFFTFLGLTAVFLRLYAGRRLKSWGKPVWVLPAFGLLSLGGVSLYFSADNVFLALSGVIWGMGAGFLYPHLSALAVEGLQPGEKSLVLSVFAAAVDLGFAVGPILFGVVSQFLGIRVAFLPIAALVLLTSSALIFLGTRAPKTT